MSTKITRSDVYSRSEKGADWFNDFLNSYAGGPTTTEILEAINQKRGETVESVVAKYREAVGLDALAQEESQDSMTAEASTRETIVLANDTQPLSIRHAEALKHDDKEDEDAEEKDSDEPQGVVLIIEQDPGIKADLESLMENSSGTKNVHSILSFLRDMLGSDLVSYSDDDLIGYINDMKGKYSMDTADQEPTGYAGKVGVDPIEDYDDNKADYIEHGKGM